MNIPIFTRKIVPEMEGVAFCNPLDVLVEVNAVADHLSLQENRCTVQELNNIVPVNSNPGPQWLLMELNMRIQRLISGMPGAELEGQEDVVIDNEVGPCKPTLELVKVGRFAILRQGVDNDTSLGLAFTGNSLSIHPPLSLSKFLLGPYLFGKDCGHVMP
jgi:hypothetical protein